jgi:hypothetical protein
VLVCDDKLDLAIYMNESGVAANFRSRQMKNAADLGADTKLPGVSGASHVMVLEKAGHHLAGLVDTVSDHQDASD